MDNAEGNYITESQTEYQTELDLDDVSYILLLKKAPALPLEEMKKHI